MALSLPPSGLAGQRAQTGTDLNVELAEQPNTHCLVDALGHPDGIQRPQPILFLR
jgi:hypothetical protein